MTAPTSEVAFEGQFANLAYTFLQDRAPALVDYVLGFQLVEKNDEGTRAFGVFGLRIGKELAYIPAFFINGEIKGVDMLYAESADIFVPLTEEWVNYFINRKPYQIGEPDGQSRTERGSIHNRLRDIFINVPANRAGGLMSHGFNKVSEVLASDKVEDWADAIGNMFVPGRDGNVMSVPEQLSVMGPKVAMGFISQLREDPKLAEAVLETYSPSDLVKKIKEDSIRVPSTDGGVESRDMHGKSPCVEVIQSIDDVEGNDSISADDLSKVLSGQRVVKDNRHEHNVSRLYELDTTKTLTSPQGPGLYRVLMGDGSFSDVLVTEPKTFGRGTANGVRLVLNPERKQSTAFWNLDILARSEKTKEEMKNTLQDVGVEADKLRRGQKVVFVNDDGISTFPCEITEKTRDTNGRTVYWAMPDYYVTDGPHSLLHRHHSSGPSRVDEHRGIWTESGDELQRAMRGNVAKDEFEIGPGGEDRGVRIIIDPERVSKEVAQTSTTTVLSGMHFRAVQVNKKLKTRDDYATVADANLHINKFASDLRVHRDGPEYYIDSPIGRFARLTKQAAFYTLLKGHAMRADDVDNVMEYADMRKLGCHCKIVLPDTLKSVISSDYKRGLLKTAIQADPSMLDDQGYVDPSGRYVNEPYAVVNTEDQPLERSAVQDIYGHEPGGEDYHKIYQRDSQAIQQAAATGQKEVLDASVLVGLLKTNDIGNKVQKFVPSLIKALDKLGRLLFLIYWHYDKFEERYGKQDIVELEDNTRTVFESLGELVNYLHQRSLFGDPEGAGLGSI